jgi:hypothetical protein
MRLIETMAMISVANTIITLSNNIKRDKALEEALTMTTYQVEEKDNGKTVIITRRNQPPMRFKLLKTWIGATFVFFLGTYFLVTVIPDLLG